MSYLTATQRRPNTSAPGDGSRTITITGAPPEQDDGASHGPDGSPAVGTLKLRGATRKARQQRVVWSDDVVDNEGCGRKSSKICCIYHKPKRFDESSDEDSSDSDSDGSCDHDHRTSSSHRRAHAHRDGGEALQNRGGEGPTVAQVEDEDSDRNVYEIAPSSKKGKHTA